VNYTAYVDIFQKLPHLLADTDASLLEINLLNRDSKNVLMALDAKFNLDRAIRHADIVVTAPGRVKRRTKRTKDNDNFLVSR
jgi:succinyl-CoA synthetase beta subunit